MHRHYHEILGAFNKNPIWWTENAYPRYCEFSPNEVDNIYCNEACLATIACQNCGTEFKVAFSKTKYEDGTLKEAIKTSQLEFGDPPNIYCCDAGPTMNSRIYNILEYWSKDDGKWKRDSSLEVEVDCGW
jgi:hypothetical protein